LNDCFIIYLANKTTYLCTFSVIETVPRRKDVAVIVLHGAAGTAVGSHIKGHQKRGGSKLTKEHRKYGTVGHTDESRTSRICSCCFEPVFFSHTANEFEMAKRKLYDSTAP
jgi:hypothetical protein